MDALCYIFKKRQESKLSIGKTVNFFKSRGIDLINPWTNTIKRWNKLGDSYNSTLDELDLILNKDGEVASQLWADKKTDIFFTYRSINKELIFESYTMAPIENYITVSSLKGLIKELQSTDQLIAAIFDEKGYAENFKWQDLVLTHIKDLSHNPLLVTSSFTLEVTNLVKDMVKEWNVADQVLKGDYSYSLYRKEPASDITFKDIGEY